MGLELPPKLTQNPKMLTGSLVLLFLLFSIPTIAGNKDLVNQAIQRGMTERGTYQIVKTNKKVKIDGLRKFLANNQYAVVDWRDDNGYLNTLDFVPKDEFYLYVYHLLSGSNPKNLKNKGRVSPIFDRKSGTSWIERWHVFGDLEDCYWTGEVQNGYVHGQGSGIVKFQNYYYLFFSGTYCKGIPISEITQKTYCFNKEYIDYFDARVKNATINEYEKKPKPNSIQIYNSHINEETKKQIQEAYPEIYKTDVALVEAEYQKALTLDISDYKNFEYKKIFGDKGLAFKFKDAFNSNNYNYDPKKIRGKVAGLVDLYTMLDGASMNVKDRNIHQGQKIYYKKCMKLAEDNYSNNEFGLMHFYRQLYKILNDDFASLEYHERENRNNKAKQMERESKIKPKYRVLEEYSGYRLSQQKPFKTVVKRWSIIFDDIKKTVMIDSHVDGYARYYSCTKPIAITYKTFDDAVAAAYIYLTTGEIRQLGRE